MTPDARATFVHALSDLFVVVDPPVIERLVDSMSMVEIKAGKTLYRQGETGQGLHVVRTGRLQVRVAPDDGSRERIVRVVRRGEAIGEIALFTGSPRVATVIATRDCTLGYLDRADFDGVLAGYPGAHLYIARFIINRLIVTHRQETPSQPIRTVAVIPLDDTMDTAQFTRRVQHALLRFGTTALIERHLVHARFPTLAESAHDHHEQLSAFLDGVEGLHDFVVLEADSEPSSWTRRCVTYADSILFVVSAATPIEDAAQRAHELAGFNAVAGPIRELALVHDTQTGIPSATDRWLEAIPVSRHYHMVAGVSEGFSRLARYFSGNAVSVIFGGGGARGFAHIGVVRALREAGLPIDMVCGTSMGAIVAAGIAMGWDDGRMLEEYKGAFVDVNPADDYTVPVFSLLRGVKMSTGLQRHFGDTRIEDLWTPFLAVSSDLTKGKEFVHRTGPVWRALRASASLPAIFPPIIADSSILVDGGLINNLPLDIARDSTPGYHIVVDISLDDEFECELEDVPSVWRHFRQRLSSPTGPNAFPTLQRVAIRSTMLGSRREAVAAREQADLFISPPVSRFDMLDWGRLLDICDVGYLSSRDAVAAWAETHSTLVQHEDFLDSCRRSGPP